MLHDYPKRGVEGIDDANPIVLPVNIGDFEALLSKILGNLTDPRCV
jgi:hypothetical protein